MQDEIMVRQYCLDQTDVNTPLRKRLACAQEMYDWILHGPAKEPEDITSIQITLANPAVRDLGSLGFDIVRSISTYLTSYSESIELQDEKLDFRIEPPLQITDNNKLSFTVLAEKSALTNSKNK